MSHPSPNQPRPSARRPRVQLSREMIVDAAIEVLDAESVGGLTFRRLAKELGAGVGSLYWHVKNRDELLQLATDAVVGDVLPVIEEQQDADPLAAIRAIAVALFRVLELHPWAAAHMLHDMDVQPNSMRFFEGFGEQTLRLNLTTFQRFQAVTAVINYVLGMGAQMAIEEPPTPEEGESGDEMRDRYLQQWAASWMEKDAESFPFAQEVAPVFADHDDFVQFASGLDLILLGLERQAGLA